MNEKNLYLSEVRICPDCELSATRKPALDTATQLAYRCDNHLHRTVLEDPPKAAEPTPEPRLRAHRPVVAADTMPVTDTPKDKA